MKFSIYRSNSEICVNKTSIIKILTFLQVAKPLGYQEINVAFLTGEEIQTLHKQFLNDPSPTDVITFPASEEDEYKIGEICISVDEAVLRAPQFDKKISDELCLYVVHGWLHLSGYGDITEEEQVVMREAESFLMSKIKAERLSIKYIKIK